MTDIEKFDRAVFEYLTDISSKIVYAPTQNAVKTITKQEKFEDKKPWNFVSFYRDSSFDIDWSRMNNPATISGDSIIHYRHENPDRIYLDRTKYIPLNLNYDVNLWASKAVEVQAMAVRLVTKIFMQNQTLMVPINSPNGEIGRFHILDLKWDDNSDIERESEIGKIYRHTISFTVDARLTLYSNEDWERFCTVPVDIYCDENVEGGQLW